MKIKTSELIDHALDWAVDVANGGGTDREVDIIRIADGAYNPSTNWAQGGPIIGRERISIDCQQSNPEVWKASCPRWIYFGYGPTPLIAAMRCYVASKLGDEVDVPDELSNNREGETV